MMIILLPSQNILSSMDLRILMHSFLLAVFGRGLAFCPRHRVIHDVRFGSNRNVSREHNILLDHSPTGGKPN